MFAAALLSALIGGMSMMAVQFNPSRQLGFQEWGKGMAAATGAFLLYFAREALPPALVVVGANILFLLMACYMALAHRRLFGLTTAAPRAWWLLGLGAVGLLATGAEAAQKSLGQMVHALAMSGLFGMSLLLLFREGRRSRRLTRRVSLVVIGVMAGAFLLRAGFSFAEWWTSRPGFGAEQFGVKTFSALFVVSASVAFFGLVADLQRQEIVAAAQRDGLTGLLTRAAFFGRAERAALKEPVYSVAMVDIDHFKAVNDRYGHQGGDTVLADAARMLGSAVRPTDIVGRYGGEEFCVVLRGCDKAAAALFGQRIVSEARQQSVRLNDGRTCGYSLSVGVATVQQLADGMEPLAHLIGRADAALYRAKRNGRDRMEDGDVALSSDESVVA